MGGTRQRHFDRTNSKLLKLPENAQTPAIINQIFCRDRSRARLGASFFQQSYPRTTAQSRYNQRLRQKTCQSLSAYHAYDQTGARNRAAIVPKPASNNDRGQSPAVVLPFRISQTLKK